MSREEVKEAEELSIGLPLYQAYSPSKTATELFLALATFIIPKQPVALFIKLGRDVTSNNTCYKVWERIMPNTWIPKRASF